jgi:hypothetical protein
MRIAFSGSHCVGKSTLLERIAEALPDHATVDEPYRLLEDEGHDFADPPSRDDFEAQLERSLAALEEADGDALFDRCPADLFAYLRAHEDADDFDEGDWIDRAREAMQTLDLVVFVPIEAPDRVPVPAHEDRGYRRAVDDQLHELLVADALGFAIELLTVHGDPDARAAQVRSWIAQRRPPRPGR